MGRHNRVATGSGLARHSFASIFAFVSTQPPYRALCHCGRSCIHDPQHGNQRIRLLLYCDRDRCTARVHGLRQRGAVLNEYGDTCGLRRIFASRTLMWVPLDYLQALPSSALFAKISIIESPGGLASGAELRPESAQNAIDRGSLSHASPTSACQPLAPVVSPAIDAGPWPAISRQRPAVEALLQRGRLAGTIAD
jgi:hypothetical protein